MASKATAPPPHTVSCPDPSAHEDHNKLHETASSAALLAAQHQRNATTAGSSGNNNVLDKNGKLSSQSAATSLKYAKAQDLPSFPSRGGTNNDSAYAAATLAKDYKGREYGKPDIGTAGSKAAMLAANKGAKLDLWEPHPSAAGNSAATLAMRNKGLSPEIDRGYTDAGMNNSLRAATLSAQHGRQRAGSTPTPGPPTYPDQQNSSKNALNAATVSHRTSTRDGWNSEANQAARIVNAGSRIDREMYTEHPPLKGDISEQQHQAALRASAASMAKGLYEAQQRASTPTDVSSLSGAGAGAETAHRRNQSMTSQPDIREQALQYIHLQDAAQRLAQERLAKVEKEHEQARYREYYGYSPKKSRLSVRGRGRKRASSDGDLDESSDSDREQARAIRTRTAQLTTATSAVDDKQRQTDRARLMAAAEKRVHAQMHDMDEKVFMDTGKPTQSMMDDWEAKARAKAEADRVERDKHPGKTHIGGGKYMDQADIEAIAAARLKPTLDEIDATAEKKRQRDIDMRVMAEQKETERMEQKMKEDQMKDEMKRIKEEERAAKGREAQGLAASKREERAKEAQQKAEFKRIRDQDKAAAKREKEERKAAERAEKEQAKARKSEEQRKSREHKRDDGAAAAGGATLAEVADKVHTDKMHEDKIQEMQSRDTEQEEHERAVEERDRREDLEKRERQREVEESQRQEILAEHEQEKEVAPVPPQQPAEKHTAQDEPKEKRGMFGRLAGRFKKHDDDDKREQRRPTSKDEAKSDNQRSAEGAAAATGLVAVGAGTAPVPSTEERARASEDRSSTRERQYQADDVDGRSAVPETAAMIASPVTSRTTDDDRAANEADVSSSEDGEDREPKRGVLAGAAAVGTSLAVAVGFKNAQNRDVGNDRGGVVGTQGDEDRPTVLDKQGQRSEISSLSSEDLGRNIDLEPSSSPEHTGHHVFAAPPLEQERARMPDLERHISTIETSSGEESDGFGDSSDDGYFAGDEERGRLAVAQPVGQQVPIVSPMGERPVDEPETSRGIDRARAESPVSPLRESEEQSPVKTDGEQHIVVVNEEAPTGAPHLVVAPRAESSEGGAPGPVVPTAPATEQKQQQEQRTGEPEKEEKGGIKGLFNKLTGRNKTENKLVKKRYFHGARTEDEADVHPDSTVTAEQSKDDQITPVTTTSAGKAQEQQTTSEAVSRQDVIREKQRNNDVEASARAESPSSFRRYDEDLNDLDDVSSSGASEAEVAAVSRRERLAKRFGLDSSKVKAKPTAPVTAGQGRDSRGDEEASFEEARDHFDESLAPPPAFAGQAKSGSPVRGTRFQEEL